MPLPDDSSIGPQELEAVRAHARAALDAADARGRYPTRVGEIMDAAQLVVAGDHVLDEGFLAGMRRKAGAALKRALSKVLGVLDASARLVYVDRAVAGVKQTFLKLHEAGHAILPWQRSMYVFVEECEKTLAPEISDRFDREANTFATEVLFQLDDFTRMAADQRFGMSVPLGLAKKFGASAYASIRRYVSTHPSAACVVLVLNPPIFELHHGFTATLRRVVTSPQFDQALGPVAWPHRFTPDDDIGALIPPPGRRMSGSRSLAIEGRDGRRHECVAEGFSTPYQVFVLIHVVSALRPSLLTCGVTAGDQGALS